MLKLLIEKPYMIRANIDVIDGLVNGAIGVLRYVEYDVNTFVAGGLDGDHVSLASEADGLERDHTAHTTKLAQ